MPNFSLSSQLKLSTCHPELQLLFQTVIKTFDCTIIEGYRDEADQNKAYAHGTSKLKFPNGKHNQKPSMAVDASPYPIDWSNIKRFYWFGGYVLGIADGLFKAGLMKNMVIFGGDWNHDFEITDEKGLNDLVHFQLVLPNEQRFT